MRVEQVEQKAVHSRQVNLLHWRGLNAATLRANVGSDARSSGRLLSRSVDWRSRPIAARGRFRGARPVYSGT